MILHQDLQKMGVSNRRILTLLVSHGAIQFGGNRRLKIYGLLSCASGKRMKVINRVFFASEQEALNRGYRPCGHCLHTKYLQWRGN